MNAPLLWLSWNVCVGYGISKSGGLKKQLVDSSW